jgi:ATP-dependent helicase/nuclease subunit A
MKIRRRARMNEALQRADDEARARALDPTHSILLQAPAGSGKTAVLTQRFLRLLCSVDEPGEILAITFTLKAAAEMRARVMHALRGEIASTDPCAADLAVLAAAALRHGAARGWQLHEDPSALRIQTMDAFNYALARQLPLAARAGAALEIADPAGALYQRAARRALLAAEANGPLAAATGVLFERLDNHWTHIERLLADMLARRGHWLRHVIDKDPHELCRQVDVALAAGLSERLTRLAAALPAAVRAGAAALPGVGALTALPASLAAWQRLAQLTLTGTGTWRARLGAGALGAGYESDGARADLRRIIDDLKRVPALAAGLAEVASYPQRLSSPEREVIVALSQVLASAAAHLQAEFAAAGRVDYTYLAGAAAQALAEEGEPTDLALRAGLALRHILVDEFQDTSLAQYQLLENLTASWEPGDGRTLFLVGDPMQSIYRFRDAEVGLFATARARGLGALRLRSLTLSRNFRSTPALVQWFNDTFGEVFPPADELSTGAVSFSASVPGRPPAADAAPAVWLRLFPGDRRGEAQALAARLAALRAVAPDSSCAVLVAAHAHATDTLEALHQHGIPALGVDLIPLGERAIVRDLVQLCRALYDLADRSAWLAVLRAPWCGVTLATLSQLSEADPAPTVWEALHDAARLARCSDAERVPLLRVRAVLAAALARLTLQPRAQWLETTWLQLGGMDAYPGEDLEDARALLRALAASAAAGQWRGPADFGPLLAQLCSAPSVSDANPVQVMTIHRAKGLQFDHVFVPGLDRAMRTEQRALLCWIDLPRPHGESDLLLAPIPAVGDEQGKDLVRLIERLNRERDAHERARLLYVAATRAQGTLWLSGAPDPRRDGSLQPKKLALLSSLWPALGGAFEQVAAPAVPAAPPPQATAALRRLEASWRAPELAAAVPAPRLPLGSPQLPVEFSWVGETQRHIGTLVHAWLARAADTGSFTLPARELLLDQLRRQAVPERERAAAAQLILSALERTFADERGRWILQAHAHAASELALSGIAAGRLRNLKIDRTFVDASGTRWIIDYKTGSHEGSDVEAFVARELERYRVQLEGYMALAASLGAHPVRAGLYFPLLGAFRELTAPGGSR